MQPQEFSAPLSGTSATAVDPRGRGTGIMFLSGFGTVWLLLGFYSMLGANYAVLSLLVALGAWLFFKGLALMRRETPPKADSQQDTRKAAFRIINIIQWAAIIGWIVVLNMIGKVDWITPGIMLVVGLHFIPLAKLFNHKGYYVTAAALSAVALVYPFVSAAGPLSPVGPIAAGLILWSTVARTLLRVNRSRMA